MSARAKKIAAEDSTIEKIEAMPEPFRGMGMRLHALILRLAPQLQATLWYGMPAYAKDGQIICFFRSDKKYMTLGLSQEANHDLEPRAVDQLRPSAWFFTSLDAATEQRIAEIVAKAAR